MSTFETKYKIGDTFEGSVKPILVELKEPDNRTYRINGIYAHMNDDMVPHIGYFLEDINTNEKDYDVSEEAIVEAVNTGACVIKDIEYDKYIVTYEEYSSIGEDTVTQTDDIYVPKGKEITDYDSYFRTRIDNNFELKLDGSFTRKNYKILSYEKKN